MDYSNLYNKLDALEEAEALLRQAGVALGDGGMKAEAEILLAMRGHISARIRDGHEAIERRIASRGKNMLYSE